MKRLVQILLVSFWMFCFFILEAQENQFSYNKDALTRIYIPREDSLYLTGDFRSSIQYNLFRIDSLGKRIPQSNYILAQNYSLLEMPDSAFYYLQLYLDDGPRDYRSVYFDEDFEILRKNEIDWRRILDRIENYYLLELDSSMNKELALQLFLLGIEGDRVFLTSVSCRRKPTPSREQQRDYSLNAQKKIHKIIRKHGLPTPSMVGPKAAEIVWSIIQHSIIKDKHYYLIKDAFENGDYNPEFYALTTDRWLVQNGKLQIYGTQFSSKDGGAITLSEVEDFPNINERREKLGLNSIEEYAKKINGIIPESYYAN